jgi:RND family efflux transporter MFP subunit
MFKSVRAAVVAIPLGLTACDISTEVVDEKPVRGLRAFEVRATASSEARRYRSIIQPAEESKLSFEVNGRLKEISLVVGQRVATGDTLAEIDPVSLELQVQQSRAALTEAESALKNTKADFDRKEQLLEKGFVTKAAFDQSQSAMNSAAAQVEQAGKQLEITGDSLTKSKLIAPFDGLISSVEVKSFGQVSPGQTVLGLYSESGYEISFSVPATIINAINVGDTVSVHVSDLVEDTGGDGHANYQGHITEIGSRAAQVSGFPVVVLLEEGSERIKAGMSAEVTLDIALAGVEEGFLIPVTCFAFGAMGGGDPATNTGEIFVFDEETGTVKARQIKVVGIKENSVIVSQGVAEGDLIASAGVSYLRDGQRVKLLPLDQ